MAHAAAKYREARASWRRKSPSARRFFYAAHPFMGGLLFDCMDFEVVNRSWDF
jgi:hypothetical protein